MGGHPFPKEYYYGRSTKGKFWEISGESGESPRLAWHHMWGSQIRGRPAVRAVKELTQGRTKEVSEDKQFLFFATDHQCHAEGKSRH